MPNMTPSRLIVFATKRRRGLCAEWILNLCSLLILSYDKFDFWLLFCRQDCTKEECFALKYDRIFHTSHFSSLASSIYKTRFTNLFFGSYASYFNRLPPYQSGTFKSKKKYSSRLRFCFQRIGQAPIVKGNYESDCSLERLNHRFCVKLHKFKGVLQHYESQFVV